MDPNVQRRKEKLGYVLGLVGRHRKTIERDITGEEDEKFIQFDTMSAQVAQVTNMEEEIFTETTELQRETEQEIESLYNEWLENGETPRLLREKHIRYLKMALGPMPHLFKSLDASQPWIIYWVCNSLVLLGEEIEPSVKQAACSRLLSMQHPDGGFGGGMGQMAHCAPSYAALLSLALLGDEGTWKKIDRKKMYTWLMSLKREDGAFSMHIGGEHDTRAVYCALVIASLLDIMTPQLVKGTSEWLSQCQTFEGGFGGVPFDEAHGGYTFCGAASLVLLGRDALEQSINTESLAKWVSSRQLKLEGGFSGRTNKLVDGCYSFWVGGVVPLLEALCHIQTASRSQLQNFILGCCQNSQYGGLRDKPSKNADFYHTNYVLLGLSIVQNHFFLNEVADLSTRPDSTAYAFSVRATSEKDLIDIDEQDRILPLNPVFGLPHGVAEKMKRCFVAEL